MHVDGLARRAPVIFGMLMYRLRRLLVTSTDKMSAETLHVSGRPYTRPSKAVAFDRAVDGAVTPIAHCMQLLTQRPQDLKLRRLSPARTYAAYMESEDRHIATMIEPSLRLDYRTVCGMFCRHFSAGWTPMAGR